jgi:hypothetical protein
MRYSILALPALFLLVLGCSSSSAPAPAPAAAPAEEQVKAAFVTLQQAIKDQKADEIWELLDKHTQAYANDAAAAWKKKLATADPEEVKKLVGISPDELAKLTGKGFLMTKPFLDDKETKDMVKAQNDVQPKMEGKDRAMVSYPNEDKPGDRDHVKFVKQDGKWKALLEMKGPQ